MPQKLDCALKWGEGGEGVEGAETAKVSQILYHSDSLLVVAIEEGGLGAINSILLEDLGEDEEPAEN